MFLARYRASSVRPFMIGGVLNPWVPISGRIQDNVTVCRQFSRTLEPLLFLRFVKAIKFLIASRLVLILQELCAT
jgi:hypothetical protein